LNDLEKLLSYLWDFLEADSTHRGKAVQEVKTNLKGELSVVLVDKVRVAELLAKVIEASAWYEATRAGDSRPCEEALTEEDLRIMRNYIDRHTVHQTR
jgi:hypothetical protein